jgi:type I restriction enzyme S subunit
MSFPTYPAYKDSGVEWLGKVPEHWLVDRLKYACKVFPSNVDKKSYENETPVRLCNYTDVYYNETIVADMDFMAATATSEQIEKFTLRAGDTIITKDSETADDIAIAAYVPEDLPGTICGYHLSMVRPNEATHGAFVKRLFDSHYARGKFNVLANGLTRVGLGQYALDNVEFPWPPLTEQQAIASFLDRETAMIDALVAEQEKLVALLKEKRQSVISHAVTQGIDPSVPMKDSGIEWLGDVPEHWEVRKVKQLSSRISSGKTPLGGNETYVDEGVLFLRSQNVYDDGLRLDEAVFISEETHQAMAVSAVQPNDILLNITGASIGRSCLVPREFPASNVNQHVCVIRLVDEEAVPYVAWFFKSNVAKNQIDLAQSGAAREGLNFEQIGAMLLPLPNATEQFQIQCFLDAETAKLDALTAEAQSAIALLQERRTALISAAVTGQIDVRHLAAA